MHKPPVNSLKWHVWVPGHVVATVEKGWVTLTGCVTWEFQRNAAADAVRYLSGVKGVTNDITLKPSVQPTAVKDAIQKQGRAKVQIGHTRKRGCAERGRRVFAIGSPLGLERTVTQGILSTKTRQLEGEFICRPAPRSIRATAAARSLTSRAKSWG